jgi:uncharacterized repeat protein (TIGR01451 family)
MTTEKHRQGKAQRTNGRAGTNPSRARRLSHALPLLAFAFLIPSSVHAQAQTPPTFQAPSVYNGPRAGAPNAVAMGDFNGDGLLDFAVAENTPSSPAAGMVEIFLGNSEGSFTSIGVVPVGTIAGQPFATNHTIGIGHFNGASQPLGVAIAVNSASGCPNGGVVVIYAPLSAPAGNSPVVCVPNPTAVTSVGVGDFNGDGFDDIAVSNASGAAAGSITVYLNVANSTSGQSGFFNYASYSTPGSPLYGTLISRDFGTGTGPSLVLLASTGPFTQFVNVFFNFKVTSLGVTALTFSPSLDASTGPNGWTDVTTAAFSGPGFTDMMGISNLSETRFISVSIDEQNAGQIKLGPLTTIASPEGFAMVEGDFNGDGSPDFAYLDQNHNLGIDLDFSSTPSNSVLGPFGLAGQGLAAGFSTVLNKWVVVDSGVFQITNSSFQQIPEARSIAVYLLDPTTGQPTPAPVFAQSATLTNSNTAPAFAVADLDGDGAPDVAVLGEDEASFAATVTPFQNVFKTAATSAAGFVQQPVFDLGGGASTSTPGLNAFAIAAGKFRSSNLSGGLPDLALVLPDGITLIENQGAFRFGLDTNCQGLASPVTNCYLGGDSNFPGFPFSSPTRPPIIAADVNGDGVDDIILAIPENCNSFDSGGAKARLYVLISNGDGSFKAPTSYSSPVANPVALAAGKLLGSGFPDLVVVDGGDVCSSSATILSSPPETAAAVLPNNHDGTGSFGSALPLTVQGVPVLFPRVSSVALGDIDGDSLLDIVLSVGDGVHVLLNSSKSPGSFTDQGTVPLYGPAFGAPDIIQNAAQIDIASFNHGGLPDAAAVIGGIAYVFPNNGKGSLNAPTQGYASGLNSGQMKAIDVNGDGAPDILVSNSQGFSVLLNNAGLEAPLAQFSAVNLSYGGIALGTPSLMLLTLGNTGGAPLIISSFDYTNNTAGQFTTKQVQCGSTLNPTSPITIPIGGNCTFEIIFTPSVLGTTSTQIVFNDNASSTNAPQTSVGSLFQQTIELTGAGVGSTANVSIAVSNSPTVVTVGTPILEYTIKLTNAGSSPATNLTFTHKLEASVLNQGFDPTQGSCTGARASGVTITCNLGTLPVNSSATIVLDVTPNAPGVLTNPFSFVQDQQDSNPESVLDDITVLSSLTVQIPVIKENIKVEDVPTFDDIADNGEKIKVDDSVTITQLIKVAAPVVFFSPSSVGFGTVGSGATAARVITVSNIGEGSTGLPLTQAATSSSAYSVGPIACSNGATSFPTTLPSGGACTLMVTLSGPAPSGVTITFTDNAALSNVTSTASGSSFTQSIPLIGSNISITFPPPATTVTIPTISEPIMVTDTVNPSFTIPVVKVGPAAVNPTAITTGTGTYVVNVTLTNGGNVAIGELTLLKASLGGLGALTFPAGTTLSNLAPGASATFTATFSNSAGAAGKGVPLSLSGTYSAGSLSGNWTASFRSVALP